MYVLNSLRKNYKYMYYKQVQNNCKSVLPILFPAVSSSAIIYCFWVIVGATITVISVVIITVIAITVIIIISVYSTRWLCWTDFNFL